MVHCVGDNVGTWHLQEVDPLNSGEEENENKNWHLFFHHVTFSLDSVPSFHFYFFGSFLVTDEVIFKQQGVEPELGLTFLQPLLVHRRCILAQENMVCCLLTSTAECFLFGTKPLFFTICADSTVILFPTFLFLSHCVFSWLPVIASFHLSFDILYSTVLL